MGGGGAQVHAEGEAAPALAEAHPPQAVRPLAGALRLHPTRPPTWPVFLSQPMSILRKGTRGTHKFPARLVT